LKTIQLELNDDLYSNITENGIDIQAKFKEFLFNITDDGYPSISTNEAKARVKDAVEDYKENGLKNFKEFDDNYWDNLDTLIDDTKAS